VPTHHVPRTARAATTAHAVHLFDDRVPFALFPGHLLGLAVPALEIVGLDHHVGLGVQAFGIRAEISLDEHVVGQRVEVVAFKRFQVVDADPGRVGDILEAQPLALALGFQLLSEAHRRFGIFLLVVAWRGSVVVHVGAPELPVVEPAGARDPERAACSALLIIKLGRNRRKVKSAEAGRGQVLTIPSIGELGAIRHLAPNWG
jgi:hypothetical protein